VESHPGAEVLASDGSPPRPTPRTIRLAAAGLAIVVLVGAAVLVWRHVTAVPMSPAALSAGGDQMSATDSETAEYTFAFPVLNFLREPVEIGNLVVRAPSDRVTLAVVTSAGFDHLSNTSRIPPAATVIPPTSSVIVLIRVRPDCAAASHFASVSVRYRTAGHAYRTQFLDPPTVTPTEDAFASLARQICLPA